MNQQFLEEPKNTSSSRSVEGTVVDTTLTFLLVDRLNLFSDVYHQCSNDSRVFMVDVVLEGFRGRNLEGLVQERAVSLSIRLVQK